ncbi:hypothetical protein NBRC110019_00580 [Neptunitalea chrysea]|uniref:Uncharacterized protein n=2 Tax=Neptunitalea chrysea TaxID=1647581 RepID=A0A9W6ETG5_9FLAO|nr:hypothetical protein NBRC110019_00580 [Neptunitalea chrysea]
MLSSKHYYTPLDVVKTDIQELGDFKPATDTMQVVLKGHISLVMLFDEDPIQHVTEISNVNEKAYKWAKGYKGFQLIFVVPEEYKESEPIIREKIGEYVDLKYWTFVFGSNDDIHKYYQNLKQGFDNDTTFGLNTHFYIIDKELGLRGRKDDEKGMPLYGYDATNISELHKKVVSDLRILFQEYRDKRSGKFNSDQRRLKELSDEE